MVDDLELILIAKPIAEIEYFDTLHAQKARYSYMLLLRSWENILYIK